MVNSVPHYSWVVSRALLLTSQADFNLVTFEQWAAFHGSSPDSVIKTSSVFVLFMRHTSCPVLLLYRKLFNYRLLKHSETTRLAACKGTCWLRAATCSCVILRGGNRTLVGHSAFLLIECHRSQPDESVNVNRSRCSICSLKKSDKDEQPVQCRKCQGDLHI